MSKLLCSLLLIPAIAFGGLVTGGGSGGGSSTFTGGTVSGTITNTATAPEILTYGGATSGSFDSILSQTNETAIPRPAKVFVDGVTTNGSPTVTSATATFNSSDLHKAISGTGIPASTFVGIVNSATSIGLSSSSSSNVAANATASGTVTLTIAAQASQALGNFELTTSLTAASNGAGRRDNQWIFGYNSPSAAGYVANDDSFSLNFENSYTTGASIRQGEFYFAVVSGDGVLNSRPFGITPAYDLHTIDAAIRANTVEIGWLDGTFDWATFQSTASTGVLQLSGASKITYNGSNSDFITKGASNVLGYDVTNSAVRVASDGNHVNIFGANNVADGMLLSLGKLDTTAHNRGLRWNGTAGWQFQTGDATWQAMGSPLMYWPTSTTAGIGPVSFSNTASATFEVYDATASTGKTMLRVRAGAGQNLNLIDVANNADTSIWKVDSGGTMYTNYVRDLSSPQAFALQNSFDGLHLLLLGSGGDIGWSSITAFSGTVDVGLHRNAAGVLEVNSGTDGTFRELKARSVIHAGVTIANLPGSPTAGQVAYVTDGDSSLAWGATAVNSGAGATKYLVWYNGANWTVAGK